MPRHILPGFQSPPARKFQAHIASRSARTTSPYSTERSEVPGPALGPMTPAYVQAVGRMALHLGMAARPCV